LPKESGRFDLPIAIGILVATGQLPGNRLHEYEFAGELALTGELRPIRGALAMTLRASGDGRAFILPQASAAEAALVREAVVYPARSLLEVCAHLAGHEVLPRHVAVPEAPDAATAAQFPDIAEVKGQPQAKRALEIAAAGSHSLLMIGPPGTGKSMLAQRLPGILPAMREADALEAAAIQSLTGGFRLERWDSAPIARRITRRRPWRWSAAAATHDPEKSRWRIMASCSSTNCRNSIAGCSKCCANRSSPAASTSRARRGRRSSRRSSSWSRR